MSTELISYDPSGVDLPEHGLSSDALAGLAPKLESARQEVIDDARLWASGDNPPKAKQPLDAGFHELPERLLAEYREKGPESEIARIQATADRLAAFVDRAVVL